MRPRHPVRRAAPVVARGFSLIELMVALIVAGILAGFAVAAYQQKIRRGYARAASVLLVDLAGRQDAYYAKARKYAATLEPLLGSSVTGKEVYADEAGKLSPAAATDSRFRVELTNPNGTGSYQLQMSVLSTSKQWRKDECARWTVDNAGRRTADKAGTGTDFVADSVNECWE